MTVALKLPFAVQTHILAYVTLPYSTVMKIDNLWAFQLVSRLLGTRQIPYRPQGNYMEFYRNHRYRYEKIITTKNIKSLFNAHSFAFSVWETLGDVKFLRFIFERFDEISFGSSTRSGSEVIDGRAVANEYLNKGPQLTANLLDFLLDIENTHPDVNGLKRILERLPDCDLSAATEVFLRKNFEPLLMVEVLLYTLERTKLPVPSTKYINLYISKRYEVILENPRLIKALVEHQGWVKGLKIHKSLQEIFSRTKAPLALLQKAFLKILIQEVDYGKIVYETLKVRGLLGRIDPTEALAQGLFEGTLTPPPVEFLVEVGLFDFERDAPDLIRYVLVESHNDNGTRTDETWSKETAWVLDNFFEIFPDYRVPEDLRTEIMTYYPLVARSVTSYDWGDDN